MGFTINVPNFFNNPLEAQFKIFDGKLDLINFGPAPSKTKQQQQQSDNISIPSSGYLNNQTYNNKPKNQISNSSNFSLQEDEEIIQNFQKNESKLIKAYNDQSKELERMTTKYESLRNQIGTLTENLEKARAECDVYKKHFESVLHQQQQGNGRL